MSKEFFLGKRVIVRTYSAGVFFGEILEKDGDRVILKDSRMLWEYKANKSIALSGVARHGIDAKGSTICGVVPYREVTAIEILDPSIECTTSIDECPEAEQV